MIGKKFLAGLLVLGALGAPGILAAQEAGEAPLIPVVTDADVEGLHALLLQMENSGTLLAASWHDLNRDGIPEAFAVMKPGEDGRSAWSLYEPSPDGPQILISDSAITVSMVEPSDGTQASIVSDKITWIMTKDGIRPTGDIIQKNSRKVTSPNAREVDFLAHMGNHGMVRDHVDVYRVNFIPGQGGERIIVMRDVRFTQEDGSWPYMIIDRKNRILISGRSADRPYIFTSGNDPIEIVEVRDGGIKIRGMDLSRLQ